MIRVPRVATKTPDGVHVITDAKWPVGQRFERDAVEFRMWYRATMHTPLNVVPFVNLGSAV